MSIALINGQSDSSFQEINKVWAKFSQAFETHDHELMGEIHSERLIRVSGKWIKDYETAMNGYKKRFIQTEEDGTSINIELRFFERVHDDSISSERGVYQLKRKVKDQQEKAFYGQFHVIMLNEDGQWKIQMDYDSDESGTIDQEDFENCKVLDDWSSFLDN